MDNKLRISGSATNLLRSLRNAGVPITDLENIQIHNEAGEVIGLVTDVSIEEDKWYGEISLPTSPKYAEYFGFPMPQTFGTVNIEEESK